VKHQTLLELRVAHDGYPDGRCTDARIEPRAWEPNGTRALERHRLLARHRPDGLDVLGRVDDRGRPFLDFDDLTLGFDLRASDGELLLRSDLAPLQKLAAPTSSCARARPRCPRACSPASSSAASTRPGCAARVCS
jgi:hypothetical protein